jgi:hypothetical protein
MRSRKSPAICDVCYVNRVSDFGICLILTAFPGKNNPFDTGTDYAHSGRGVKSLVGAGCVGTLGVTGKIGAHATTLQALLGRSRSRGVGRSISPASLVRLAG